MFSPMDTNKSCFKTVGDDVSVLSEVGTEVLEYISFVIHGLIIDGEKAYAGGHRNGSQYDVFERCECLQIVNICSCILLFLGN